MIISVNRVKLLAIITAIIIIPFIGINLINNYLQVKTAPTSKIIGETSEENGLTAVNPPVIEVKESGLLAEYRMERERVRSKELTQLKEITNNAAAAPKAREAASIKLVNLVGREEKEMQAETMIKSQGFKDCVVVVTEVNTTVMVEGNNLVAADQEAIRKTVSSATGSTEKTVSVVKLQSPQK